MSEIKLLRDRVLVEPLEETTLKSGLVVPTSKEPGDPQLGVVTAVGLGKIEYGVHIPMKVKVGDKVMYQYSIEVTVDDDKYRLMKEDDIIMVID